MKEQRNLLVGYDLSNDYTQISCFNYNTYGPETIKFDYDSDKELLDTVMAINKETKEWMIADEAIRAAKEGKAILITNIVEAALRNKNVKILDNWMSPVELLSIYFRKTLSLIKRYHPNESIQQLVVCVAKTDIVLVKAIFEALKKMGINKDRDSVQSHSQSFLYYALNQKKELWMNDVALFDYGLSGLNYYQISVDRKHRPITVSVSVKDFSEEMNFKMLNELSEEEIQEKFRNIASYAIHKQIISTIYLTGKGMAGKWVNDTLGIFGHGKRIFKGINLFSEGACYAARVSVDSSKFADFVFLSEDMVTTAISVNAYCEAKQQELIFIKTATPWYEADKTYEFILDNLNEIEIVIRDDFKNTKISHIMYLDLNTARPNKTTRVKMRVRYLNPKVCVITVKDLGFGEFYKSTNRIWEKILDFN